MAPASREIVTVKIEDLAYGGLGVGRVNGMVVFVEKALPGETVQARIVKKKKKHAQAVIHEIERASAHRVAEPPCPVFGRCGGCTWQNLDYGEQVKWKGKQVGDLLKHLGGQTDYELLAPEPSPEIWRYRNKMEFTFGTGEAGEVILGFHKKKRFDTILPVDVCMIQPAPFDRVLAILVEHAREHGLTAYDPRSHEGFLRHAVLRHSKTTGGSIVVLITQEGELPEREALAARLRAEIEGFQGMLWGINRGLADVARVEEERWREGELELSETINGLTFRISPASFFQTNTRAAERLYALTVEMAQLGPDDRVLDAYCGTGSIALHCAREAGRVVGVEVVRDAIWDARVNARRNGVENATFLAAPMARGLDLARQAAGGSFTRVIIDPPRGGMDKKAMRGLLAQQAEVFVYVSCNPSTLARDLQTICEGGYRVEQVKPVDMFPHTYHIETVVRLRREAVSGGVKTESESGAAKQT